MFPFPIQIHGRALPALGVGAFLLACSIALTLKQWWAYRRLTLNAKVNEAGYQIAERQIRHRFVVAVMLFVLGVAIPLGDQMDMFFRGHPALFFFYWMGVLLVVFVMVIVALGDIVSTLAYARLTQGDLRRERSELEEQIRQYRSAKAAENGTHTDE